MGKGKNGLIVLTSLVVIGLIFAGGVMANNGSDKARVNDRVRVIAHTDKEVSDAVSRDCRVVRKARTMKALLCPENVAAALGLQEDVRVFAMDSGANTQIKADLVQAAGNTGQGRKVVVIDTGYNYTHPELISSYLGGKDFVNSDEDPMDDNGHGSHVAGIITADGLDSKAKGVAPDTGIIAAKVLDASGGGYFSDIVASIYWAVDGQDGIYGTADDFNADAISMSLGTGAPYLYKGFCDDVLSDLTAAIKYAKDKGVLVVVAAGNSGTSGVSIPGCISHSTTVGAVDSLNRIASWSGRGNALDIAAPGVNIYSSILGNGYDSWSGTSMATPMVSGVAALIKAVQPTYTPAQIETALFSTAKDLGKIGWDSTYGWGLVNAYAAVPQPPDTTPPVISGVNGANITSISATINWTTDEPSNSVVNYGTTYGTTTPPGSTVSDTAMVTSHSLNLTGLAKNTVYYYEVQSTDASGNTAADNNGGSYYTFTTLSNQPPVANAGSDQSVYIGTVVNFNGSASYDSDGAIVSYNWDFGDGTTTGTGVTTSHTYSVAGTYTVTLTVTDNDGATGADTALVTVNEKPTAVLCWSGSNQYLYRDSNQAKKFCKCSQGTYGYKNYKYNRATKTVWRYLYSTNNEDWTVTSLSSRNPVYSVTCSDGKAYPTNVDYYYPK